MFVHIRWEILYDRDLYTTCSKHDSNGRCRLWHMRKREFPLLPLPKYKLVYCQYIRKASLNITSHGPFVRDKGLIIARNIRSCFPAVQTEWPTFLYFDLHAYINNVYLYGRYCWPVCNIVYCDSNIENVQKHLLFQVSSRITIITSLLRSILKSRSRCKLFQNSK